MAAVAAVLLVVRFHGAAAAAVYAETTDIQGSISNQHGQPVGGAFIELGGAGAVLSAKSDAAGVFSFTDVKRGRYVLSVSARGYEPLVLRDFTITRSGVVRVDLVLAAAGNTSLVSLGTVRVNGALISRASAPSVDLDPQDLAGRGIEQLSDVLSQQIAVTMTRPAGGAPGLPQAASLRGPDPRETVIDIDGHRVNNGSTGDFDLSLIDTSEFQSAQVVFGIGPSSLVGASTMGGAINFRTIDPTSQPHGLLRVAAGSFGTFAATLQATGTGGRWGYAASLHRFTTRGEITGYPVIAAGSGARDVLGSDILATTDLAKLRYALGGGGGFIEATYRNTVATRDLSAALATPVQSALLGPGALFQTVPGAAAQTLAPAFGVDLQLPLGPRNDIGAYPARMVARHQDSDSSQSVPPAVEALANPYLFNQADRVVDDSVQYDRDLADASLTLLYDVRREALRSPAALAPGPGQQSQTGRSFLIRYQWKAAPELDLTAGAYVSSFDTFGRSFDPRFAAVWSPSPNQVVRASIGTAFDEPLLTERVFNPALRPERTTEYELGYERRFGDSPQAATAALDAYRTNLRDPIFFTTDANGALTFLKNLGRVVYTGAELRLSQPLSAALSVHAAYGMNIAYPRDDPFAFDPSAPNVVAGQQFQGIPAHKAQLSLDARSRSAGRYFVAATYESANNELNRPPYTVLSAGASQVFHNTEVALLGRNLSNVADGLFTVRGAGTPYPTPAGPAPTDAFALQGRSLTLTVTQRY